MAGYKAIGAAVHIYFLCVLEAGIKLGAKYTHMCVHTDFEQNQRKGSIIGRGVGRGRE